METVVRLKLNSWEMRTVYRLLDAKYWHLRNLKKGDDYYLIHS